MYNTFNIKSKKSGTVYKECYVIETMDAVRGGVGNPLISFVKRYEVYDEMDRLVDIAELEEFDLLKVFNGQIDVTENYKASTQFTIRHFIRETKMGY